MEFAQACRGSGSDRSSAPSSRSPTSRTTVPGRPSTSPSWSPTRPAGATSVACSPMRMPPGPTPAAIPPRARPRLAARAKRGPGLPLGLRSRRRLTASLERGDARRGPRRTPGAWSAASAVNAWVELQRPFWRRDRARNRHLAQLAERLGVATVATGNVHAHDRRRAELQDAFVAVRLHTTLEEAMARRGNSSSVLASGADDGPFRRPPGGGRRDSAPGAAAARPRPASSATATREPRTPRPTAPWPRSAAAASSSATRAPWSVRRPSAGSRRS